MFFECGITTLLNGIKTNSILISLVVCLLCHFYLYEQSLWAEKEIVKLNKLQIFSTSCNQTFTANDKSCQYVERHYYRIRHRKRKIKKQKNTVSLRSTQIYFLFSVWSVNALWFRWSTWHHCFLLFSNSLAFCWGEAVGKRWNTTPLKKTDWEAKASRTNSNEEL